MYRDAVPVLTQQDIDMTTDQELKARLDDMQAQLNRLSDMQDGIVRRLLIEVADDLANSATTSDADMNGEQAYRWALNAVVESISRACSNVHPQ